MAAKRIAAGGDREKRLEEEEQAMARVARRLKPFLSEKEWALFTENLRPADPDFIVSKMAAQSPRSALYYLTEPQWLRVQEPKSAVYDNGVPGLEHLRLPEEDGGLPEEWMEANEWKLRKL